MLSKGLRGHSVPWLPSVQAGALSAPEISDSDNKQLLVQRIGLGPFKAQPLPQSLSFILCFRSKVHPPCPEQQQVYHKMLAGFAVCRGRYYSPSGSLCKRAAVTGIAEPGAGIEPAGDAHLCVPPETKDGHRIPLGPCFSADSAPADLRVHWSHWSLGSCIFWWEPESEAASLHLHHHSPSSHLLRGNVCHSTWGQVQRPQESSWLHSSLGESSEEEMPQAHRDAPSSARSHELRHDLRHLPEIRSSTAP